MTTPVVKNINAMYKQLKSDSANRPRLTVAAVAEKDGRFLLVEERIRSGELVLNQPAGHVEHGETLLQAVVRETLEETAWDFQPEFLVGVYLWQHPMTNVSFLRVTFAGSVTGQRANWKLDEGIEQALWLTQDELRAQSGRHRSPLVQCALEDYLAGERYPMAILKSLLS